MTEGSSSLSSHNTSGVVLRNRGGGERTEGSSIAKSSHNQMVIEPSASSSTSTPRLAIKGFRQKLGKAISTTNNKDSSSVSSSQKGHHSHHSPSSSSPKSSRKESIGENQHHHSFPNGNSGGSGTSKGTSSSGYHHHSNSSSRKSSRSGSSAMTKTSVSGTASGDVNSAPNVGNIISVESNNGSGSTANSGSGASFLRQPKTGSSNNSGARDSKNRVSGSGIPTRNSLIERGMHNPRDSTSEQSAISGGGMSANNNLVNINNASNNINNNNSVSTTSLNSTASSTNATSSATASAAGSTTNGVLQSLGNGTGIPKPTAAVKGTTKQSTSGCHQKTSSISTSQNESACSSNGGDSGTSSPTSNKQITNKNDNNPKALDNNVDAEDSAKREMASCSSSDSRSNLSQNSFSSEKSLCSNNGSGGGNSVLNKTSTSSSIKSTDTSSSNAGITVALVSPMPSLTNSVSNTASVSSIESNISAGLTQSQFSASSVSQSNSNSNSSDVTVMLASKYQQQLKKQQSSLENIDSPSEQSANISDDKGIKIPSSCSSSTALGSIHDEISSPPSNCGSTNNKISPLGSGGFVSSTASGSSSMGSLKCSLEMGSSSSGTSLTSPTCIGVDGIPEEEHCESGKNANETESESELAANRLNSTNIQPIEHDNRLNLDNGNSVIPECDEDDALLNVKPMEPLLRNSPYGYIKSPPGTMPSTGNASSFFPGAHHPKSPGSCIQMRRAGLTAWFYLCVVACNVACFN